MAAPPVRRNGPEVVLAAFLVREEEPRAVPGPERPEAVGGGEGRHRDGFFGPARRVEEVEIGDVQVPVLLLLHRQHRDAAPVGGPRRGRGDGAQGIRQLTLGSGRHLRQPDVVGPGVRLVRHVGDGLPVGRPGDSETHLVGGHRAGGELTGLAARRLDEPDVLPDVWAAARARHDGDGRSIGRPGGSADSREPVGQRGGIRISDRSGEEVSVPQEGDPAAVRRPGRRTPGEPETQHRWLLGEVEEVDPAAVGAFGDRRDPAPVGGDGCPGDAAAGVAEDVLEGEGDGARLDRIRGAAAGDEGEHRKSAACRKGPRRQHECASAKRQVGCSRGWSRHHDDGDTAFR